MENRINHAAGSRARLQIKYLHMFEEYLNPQRKIAEINIMFGYSSRSMALSRHCSKVMDRIIDLENASKSQNFEKIISPRDYATWWKMLFYKHKQSLENACPESTRHFSN